MPPPSLHFEPYVHVAGLSHNEVLLSWGGFFFRPGGQGGTAGADEWVSPDALMIVDDEALSELQLSRKESIGEGSRSYGEAVVRITQPSGELVREVTVRDRNHVWIDGLEPDTTYQYSIRVNGEDWLRDARFDWARHDGRLGLVRSGRRYTTAFRTHPSPTAHAPLAFAVLGDFGVGTRTDQEDANRQRALAAGLERAVEEFGVRLVITTGDNVYLGEDRTGASGDEDDDWFFTFYQPYRYLLSRLPFYPAVGNHDAGETEQSDDRAQLEDNFFLHERFTDGREAERASADPGLFYRFRYGADVEFVCLDTTKDGDSNRRFFESPKHGSFLDESFPAAAGGRAWRIPFSHHPVFCAGPAHGNTAEMEAMLVPRFERAGVRLVLAGHEHNFQYSRLNGVHYILSGAGGKLRPDPPRGFERAHTVAWSAEGHFLIVELDDSGALVHALTADDHGELRPIQLHSVGSEKISLPIAISR